ncbi:MAG: aminoglycoside phosphotransferase, partial [Cyanobacteria bacterium RYN_339]|nr:aminoglycoside phosphotransferase [Cyanobacteria bacterium RYN_339]
MLSQATDSMHDIAAHFLPPGRDATIREFGNGNINKTYLVTPADGVGEPFLLQRLNTRVFQRPDLVMSNIRAVSRHVTLPQPAGGRRWEVPRVLLTRGGADHWLAADGSFWRAWQFIGQSRTVETVGDAALAREVGYALGTFHALLSDLPTEELADTLPGFHIAPTYLAHFDAVAPLVSRP